MPRRSTLFGLLLALLLPLGAAADGGDPDELESPSPGLDAEAVIDLVLDALAAPDEPYDGAGIEQVWRFASPDNRTQTGPLERFRSMVESRPYAPLLDHKLAQRGELRQSGDRAYQEIAVVGPEGTRVTYAFQLGRYDTDDCEACWFTDAVIPIDREEPEAI